MVVFGDPETFRLILGIVTILLIYWVVKWVISLWTGA